MTQLFQTASDRLTNLDVKAKEEAGMTISIPKTKAQQIKKRPYVSCTTESDVSIYQQIKS